MFVNEMNRSDQALNQALHTSRSLFDSENPVDSNDLCLKAVGFCMRRLNAEYRQLVSEPGSNIQEFLDQNDIHHRLITPPLDLQSKEYPLMIMFKSDNDEPLVLYRNQRKNYFYDPTTDAHSVASINVDLADKAYEIYPSLPTRVLGPLSVFGFSFATELASVYAILVVSVVVMIFNLSIPVLTNILVARVLPQSDSFLLLQAFTAVILITIALVSAQYLQNLMIIRLESSADLRLQTAVWDRLTRLPLDFLKQYTTGDLVSRVDSINQLRQLLGSGILSGSLSALFSLSYFVLMFIYDAELARIALIFSLCTTIVLLYILYGSIKLQLPLLECGAEVSNFSLQAVSGVVQIRSAGAEPFIFLQWIRKVARYITIQNNANLWNDSLRQYTALAAPLSNLLIFSVVTYRVLNAASEYTEIRLIISFISFYAAFSAFNSSFVGLVNLMANTIGRVYVLWRRAEPIMYADVEEGYQTTAIHHNLEGSFQIKQVGFTYDDAPSPIFDTLSFDIPSKCHTAITGPSGCGKSTIVKMLLGFTKPQKGSIYVDGIPLSKLSVRSYRRQIGVVLQMVKLHPGTIYDVVCGGIESTEAKVWDALEKAAIAEEIKAMPMKLNTFINSNTGNLSGGQVQRLALARALLPEPKVLILDEATSALDNHSQQKISSMISSLGITRITIAHRLSTIEDADKIIVIESGKVSDTGTWNLIKDRGYIAKMLHS